ncbi:MAG TPA: hypothetical protein VF121_13260 [Thermoanaerobaculia bacterium]|nr:hypothetical protein [Thermoanaerobaculia bacterium]
MPYVIIVFGASGSGKSTLMETLAAAGGQYSIHIKATDRSRRKYDGIEINAVRAVLADEYDYIYQTYGYRYGIQRSQIDAALAKGQHHFVICNDIDIAREIKRDYGDRARLVFHYFDAPRSALLDIQKQRKIKDDEIDRRLAKIDVLYGVFVEEWSLFDGTLVNHFGEERMRLRQRMDRLLQEFTVREKQTRQTEQVARELLISLEHHLESSRRLTAVEPDASYAFVLMAMSGEDPSLEDTYAAIKRACAAVGVRAERVDDIQFTGQITEKILGSIEMAGVIIADVTHERPNVYYEIGYAQGQGEECHFGGTQREPSTLRPPGYEGIVL